MQGAREYARLFETGQYGRLYLVSEKHARGKTFHVWVLPEGIVANSMPWSVPDAVEVYGITGGHPGWTETYGWLHRGKWEQDFAELVKQRRSELVEIAARAEKEKAESEAAKQQHIAKLLAAY